MPDREEITAWVESRVEKLQGIDYRTEILGLQRDMLIKRLLEIANLLREQELRDKMFHALEEDWKKLQAMQKEQELVMCKDCKHWSAERINDYNKCKRWINVGVKNFATMGDWYCADGERKEGR